MRKIALFLLIVIPLAMACEEEVPVPRPKGYYRMEFPEKRYELEIAPCPFSFERPFYSVMVPAPSYSDSNCALNLEIPKLRATLHLTYLKIDNNLDNYLESCRRLAYEHRVVSDGIGETLQLYPDHNVYGLIYNIDGEVASNMQFYATDSTNHFLRGSLYFNAAPNADSLAPSLEYIVDDIYHLIESLEWGETEIAQIEVQ